MIRRFCVKPGVPLHEIKEGDIPSDADAPLIVELIIPNRFQDGELQKDLNERLRDFYDSFGKDPGHIIAGWAVADLVRLALDDVLNYPGRYGSPGWSPADPSLIQVHADPLDAIRMTLVAKNPVDQALRLRQIK